MKIVIFRKADPQKALVMSFHGWTGAGKNYVAKFVAEYVPAGDEEQVCELDDLHPALPPQ